MVCILQGRLAVADALQSYCGEGEGRSLPVLCGGDDRTMEVIYDARGRTATALERGHGLQETRRPDPDAAGDGQGGYTAKGGKRGLNMHTCTHTDACTHTHIHTHMLYC